MRTQLYANNAKSTLASPITNASTTIPLAAGTGALFPTPGADQFFLVTIESGGSVEILDIVGRTGDSLTVRTSPTSGRGQEGTTAASWGVGAAVELRTTAGILDQFTRKQDRLYVVSSVDTLSKPSQSDSNSYICQSVDDGGNPVVAIYLNSTTWRFLSHSKVVISGSISSATSTSITSTAIGSTLAGLAAGRYIIQFTSGVNQGTARMVTTSGTNTLSWATAYGTAASASDTFEVYQSTYSILSSTSVAADSLIYSIIFGK